MRLCLLSIALVLSGCAGEVQSKVDVVLPEQAPAPQAAPEPEPQPTSPTAPVDEDGDGVAADDKCPTEKETANGYQDDDGCPDEPPNVYLAGDEIKLKNNIVFKDFGFLDSSAERTLDDVAKLLKADSDIQSLEVGAHVWGGATTNKAQTSKARAGAVVSALVKRGIDKKRLSAAGFGDKCPPNQAGGGDTRTKIELKVVTRAGNPTGVERGCR